MSGRRSLLTMTISAALAAAVVAAPGLAQSPSAPAEPPASILVGPTITVIAMDYHFGDLPTTVPVGTTITLENQGAEVHELIIARKNDGVTKTWEELIAMEGNEAFQYVTLVAEMPLFAAPGATAEGALVIAQEGEYIALCFVPQGMTEFPDPSASPNPAWETAKPHFMLGMMQTFTGTEAGTEVGPLPSAAPMAPEGSAAP